MGGLFDTLADPFGLGDDDETDDADPEDEAPLDYEEMADAPPTDRPSEFYELTGTAARVNGDVLILQAEIDGALYEVPIPFKMLPAEVLDEADIGDELTLAVPAKWCRDMGLPT